MNYHIRIKGHLDPFWQDWLAGLQIAHEPSGTTRLSGPLPDQAALFGVLLKIHRLGLILLSLERDEDAEAQEQRVWDAASGEAASSKSVEMNRLKGGQCYQRDTTMKQFLLLYKGPATPPDASHDGWRQWFTGLGEHLADVGSAMKQGHTLHRDGSLDERATPLNGYTIIQAEEREEAFRLLQGHPYLSLGDEYTVEMFDLG